MHFESQRGLGIYETNPIQGDSINLRNDWNNRLIAFLEQGACLRFPLLRVIHLKTLKWDSASSPFQAMGEVSKLRWP